MTIQKCRDTLMEGERLDEQLRIYQIRNADIAERASRLTPGGEIWYKSRPTWPPWGGFEAEGRRRARDVIHDDCGFVQPIDAAARSAKEAWTFPPLLDNPTDTGHG
jgi:hypothetical protein